MTAIGVYRLPSGQTIEIEVDENLSVGHSSNNEFTPVGPGNLIRRVTDTALDLKNSLPGLTEIADIFLNVIINSTNKAEEVSIEYSVKIGASGNFIIAGGSAEGSIKLTTKYKIK